MNTNIFCKGFEAFRHHEVFTSMEVSRCLSKFDSEQSMTVEVVLKKESGPHSATHGKKYSCDVRVRRAPGAPEIHTHKSSEFLEAAIRTAVRAASKVLRRSMRDKNSERRNQHKEYFDRLAV